MWALANHTEFAAERGFMRDEDGGEMLLVAVRATYDVADDGRVRLAREQPAPVLAPRHFGEVQRTSLHEDGDLTALKPRVDLLLEGSAHGRGRVAVEAGLRVGPFAKRLLVTGERRYERGLAGVRPGQPLPFDRLPIDYEHAFGGVDPEDPRAYCEVNPVGRGFALRNASLAGQPVPSVAPAGPDGTGTVAGFGPIARHWQPRRALAGSFGEDWARTRRPLLPLDFARDYWQCAPRDQQLPRSLFRNADVELESLTANGFLRFALPQPRLAAIARFGRFDAVVRRLELQTVRVRSDAQQVVLVLGGEVACDRRLHDLNEIVIYEKLRLPAGAMP